MTFKYNKWHLSGQAHTKQAFIWWNSNQLSV